MSEELKPCPFCGGEAEFIPYKRDGLTLRCKSLGCVRRDQRTMRQSIEWLRERMAEDWNRRTNRDGLGGEGALREAATALKIIRTWAAVQKDMPERDVLSPSSVVALCDMALGRQEDNGGSYEA